MGSAIHPALAPYVVSLTAYDVDLGAPGVHRGLPSPWLTFVLPVGAPLDVGWRDDSTSRGRRWSTVSGLHDAPAAIHHDGHQAGVQLALTTAGARALLGVPAAALAGTIVALDELAPALRHLPEQLAACAPPGRERLVEDALLARLTEVPASPAVGRALARLTRGDQVGAVAADVGYSRRHLSTVVRRECGLTPQGLRRVARFARSREVLGRLPLAEVAQRCGYADQAHLTREWAALAGCPPTTWLREEFPFLQDLHADAGAE